MSESNQKDAQPQLNGPLSVDIPRGWTRILENDVVLYISPTNVRLRSVEHVTEYLKADGTCKCGLECPVFIHKVFNFDANVKSRFVREDENTEVENTPSKCKHVKVNVEQHKPGEVKSRPRAKEMALPAPTTNKLPSFETLAIEALNKTKVPARPRNRKSASKPRAQAQKTLQRPASPLGGSPPPIATHVNNPVQPVPSNLGRDMGPLPSFASIVSSSKFFNPGASNLIRMLPGSGVAATATTSSAPSVQTAVLKPVTSASATAAAATVAKASVAISSTTPSQITSVATASAVKSTAPASQALAATLSTSSAGSSAFKASVAAVSTVASNVGTVVVSRTATRPIILGSQAKTNAKQNLAARAKAKTTSSASSKADVRAVTTAAAKLDPTTVKTATTTAPSAVMTSSGSSTSGPQRTNLPAAVPVSFTAPTKSPTSGGTAAPQHGAAIGPSTAIPTQSPVFASSAAAMTSLHQSSPVGGSVGHRGPSSAVPVYASSTPSVYSQQQQQQQQQSQASHGKQLPTSAGAFTPGQLPASAAQGSAAVAACQAQGAVVPGVPGVLVQGAGGGQLFQMNFHNVDMGQFKGAYQIYQNPFAGNTMALVNAAAPKAAFANVQPNQTAAAAAGYASPYMFGTLLMPQTTAPATAGATSTGAATTTTVMSVLPGATTYFNQNAAIAAALESFVPIAPAAAPAPSRYAQSLAHLASAYGQFAPGALVRGGNPMQFPGMPVGTYPANPMAAAAAAAAPAVLTAPESGFKYPAPVKPTTFASGSAATTSSSAKCHVPTPVVTALPYVAFGQMATPKVPIALSFTSPAQLSANLKGTPGGGVTVCGEASLVTSAHAQYASSANVEVKSSAGGSTAVVSSVGSGLTSTEANSSGGCQSQPMAACAAPQAATSQQSAMAASAATSHQPAHSVAITSTSLADNQRTPTSSHANTPPVAAPPASDAWVPRSSSAGQESSPRSVAAPSASICAHPVNSASQGSEDSQTKTPQPAHEEPLSAFHTPARSGTVSSPLNTVSKGYLLSREIAKSSTPPSNHGQSEQVAQPNVSIASPLGSGGLKRPYIGDSSQVSGNEGVKRNKYEPAKDANYYTTNPLLGLKRSCEAIEVYCEASSEKSNGNDCSETSQKNCDGRIACDNNQDGTDAGFSFGGSKKPSGCGEIEANASFAHAPPPVSTATEPSALYNGRALQAEEPGLVSLENPETASSKADLRLPSTKAPPALPPAFTLPALLGEAAVPQTRPHFDIGDIVWAQARGLPSWPGKIVDETEVGKGRPDDGKKWVMWFGDNTFSQVEVDRLKTLNEGLRTLDDKARKKKYRAKKARISLEQAISEALEALEVREKLRARQAAKGKAKKKRVR